MISIYPVFETFDITPLIRLRPQPLHETRLVLDVHLGQLAVYLRLLGFDTLYRNDYADEEMAHLSSSQERILLSRDRGLLKRSIVTHGYCLRATQPRQQLIEVLRHFDLSRSVNPFTCCLHYNGMLQPVDKDSIAHCLSPKTQHYYNKFYQCQSCSQIYWPGSHYQHMQQFIENILPFGQALNTH